MGSLGYLAGASGINANLKLYFEHTINVTGTSAQGAETGIANEDHLLTDFVGGDGSEGSTGFDASTGDIFFIGGVFGTFAALIAPAGTVVGIYTDFLHQKLWGTIDGINFYGGGGGGENPATNTGGWFPSASGHSTFKGPSPGFAYKTIYPAFGSRQSGPGGTANFKGPFALPVAAGFSPWDSGSASNFFFAA